MIDIYRTVTHGSPELMEAVHADLKERADAMHADALLHLSKAYQLGVMSALAFVLALPNEILEAHRRAASEAAPSAAESQPQCTRCRQDKTRRSVHDAARALAALHSESV